MAHIVVGKLLPNLKVDVGNDEVPDKILEENYDEKSKKQLETSDEENNVEIVRSWMNSLQNPKIYKNKSGAFTTGLDLISESNAELLDKRAERFGIEKEETMYTESYKSLYESMGVDIENKNLVKMKALRLDALHMRGVNELNTNEIFQYFKDYGPASVEWINDCSCNVVWMDETSCARALLGTSKPLPSDKEEPVHLRAANSCELSRSSSSSNDCGTDSNQKMETEESSPVKPPSEEVPSSLDIPVPPGFWRMGVDHPKAKTILLRFATKDDRKVRGAEKRSVYYQKHGNPNYGGLKGLISGSRKRKMQAATNRLAIESGSIQKRASQSDDDHPLTVDVSVQKPKPPRMRMYADDEELKVRKSRFKDLRVESKHASVHSRLGTKYTKEDLFHLGSYPRDEERDSEDEWTSLDNTDDWDEGRHREDDRLNKQTLSNRTDRWERKRNFPPASQVDLRTKIKKMKTDTFKHRSPLCVDLNHPEY